MSETRRGYRQSLGALVGAMLALVIIVSAVWVVDRLQEPDRENPVETVDFSAQLEQARDEAPFDVLAPSPVPSGWRATSARWQGTGPEVSWELGFLTEDDEDFVGLKQGNAPPDEFVPAETPADEPADPVTIEGAEWQQLRSSDGDETALVLVGDDVTTVVTGTAPLSELVTFVESLE